MKKRYLIMIVIITIIVTAIMANMALITKDTKEKDTLKEQNTELKQKIETAYLKGQEDGWHSGLDYMVCRTNGLQNEYKGTPEGCKGQAGYPKTYTKGD